MIDCKNEISIVALPIEEATIGRQITAAKPRAEERYPEYNTENTFRKRINDLIAKQDIVIQRINSFVTQNEEKVVMTPTEDSNNKKRALIKSIAMDNDFN